jgi:VWFA-related protein
MKLYIVAIFTLLFAFSVSAQKQAEVIVTSTYLRKSPDIASEKVQTVQKGEKVVFERNRDTNGWYYVSLSNGTIKGWIRKDTIGSITNAEKIKQTPPASVPTTSAPTKSVVTTSPTTTVSTPALQTSNAAPVKSMAPVVSPTPSPSPAEAAEIIEDEVLRVDTAEVSLNVRVVNDNNRPVGNLNESHFRVYEDDVLQPISSLTTAEVPVINALVIDNSRSLRSQLAKISEAGKIIVGTNRPKDESVIVRFVSSNKIEVVQDFTPNKTSLNNALDNLFVEGGETAIIDAVYRTAKKLEQYQNSGKKEDVKLRTLILVSDGDDRGSTFKEQELFKLLRESNVQIYAVGFVNNLSNEPESGALSRREKAKVFLTRLAQETGGKVYFPDSIDELSQIAADISAEQRTQYLIPIFRPMKTATELFEK